MKHLSQIVGENQKRLRNEQGLSLDALAKASGVSKTRLSQIERGEANPSMSTLWQIANALRVVFSELVTPHEDEGQVVRADLVEPVTTDDGRARTYLLFPFDSAYGFEYYTVQIEQDGRVVADAHPAGTIETITLLSGELAVHASGQATELGEGDTFRFPADQAHEYVNVGEKLVEFTLIVAYSRRG